MGAVRGARQGGAPWHDTLLTILRPPHQVAIVMVVPFEGMRLPHSQARTRRAAREARAAGRLLGVSANPQSPPS